MEAPQILVRKSGFLASLAKGVFGFLTVTVMSATVLGLFGMHIVDKRLGSLGKDLGPVLSNWREILPIADSLNDRRAPEYRGSVAVSAALESRKSDDENVVVLSIANSGAETISMLNLRVTIEDEKHVPVRTMSIVAATPIVCDDWIGPILPPADESSVQPRRIAKRIHGSLPAGCTVRTEITDLRVAVPLPPRIARGPVKELESARADDPIELNIP